MASIPSPAAGNASQFIASLLGGLAVGTAFAVAAFSAPEAVALRSGMEHALLDVGLALSACFCSLQALVRYQSRPQPLFLWLGAGFLASGVLDGLHALLSLEPPGSVASRAATLAWTAGGLLLAMYVLMSLSPQRPEALERRARLDPYLVGVVTVGVLALLAFVLVAAAPGLALSPVETLPRPGELVTALGMLLALPLLWRRRELLDPPLRRRLTAALAIYVIVHGGIMAWSSGPLDTFVGASHLARLLAHWLVLVGLLQSSANLLTEAEDAHKRLAVQADELEASERHLRSILNHAPYAILSAGHDGLLRSINPVAVQMFATPQAEAAGRPLGSFFDAAFQSDLAATLGTQEPAGLRAAAGGDDDADSRSRWVLSREARGIRASGHAFPVAVTLTDTIAGGQRFLTAFVRDLTTALQQEQRLHQALNLATRILDQSSVAIWSTDGRGVITRFNRTAQQWLGYSESAVKGRLTPIAFVDPAELLERARELERDHDVAPTTDAEVMLALARRGDPEQREWTLLRQDGSRFPANVSVAPLTNEAGAVNGFVMVATDLSEQKEVARLKNEFVSNVSHELRTPLTSVRGSLGLLAGGLAGKLPAQAQGLLEIAQRNTERLILLINDILDIEKIEAGKMRFSMKPLDLDALVADAVQQSEGLAAQRSVKLVLRARSPRLHVNGDEHRLLQVASNLLSNAIKFSPEGGTVHVDVSVGDGLARVTVTDYGPGIPQSSQGRIFQKFFQADASSAREKGGTGLGLSICKVLVERMDGHIGFTSKPGETVFHFELPTAGAGGRSRRVLLVEDDADAAAVLCRILEQDGVEVDTAGTAAQARQRLQDRSYDCLLLDSMLPDGDGLELLRQLRQQESGRGLPTIVVSIFERNLAQQAALGISEWLTKPIDAARLRAALRRVLAHAHEGGVLLVEDDLAMSELLRRLLSDLAPVTVARSVAEGRAQIERQPWALVLLDLGLPDGIGHDLLPLLKQAQPRTPVVVFSEHDASNLVGKVTCVLSKSRTGNDELLRIMQELLRRSYEQAGGAPVETRAR